MPPKRTSRPMIQPRTYFVPVSEIPADPYRLGEIDLDDDNFPDEFLSEDKLDPDPLANIDPEVLELFAEAAQLGGYTGHVRPEFPEGPEFDLQCAEYDLG